MNKKRRKKYRLKKWVKKTLLIIFIMITALIGTKIFKKYYVIIPKNQAPIITDITTLRYEYHNDEIKARLIIPNIGLNSIITQTKDNDYYLNYNINREKSDFGNPFLDYRQKKDLSKEKQINIYGHNLSGEWSNKTLPFSKLTTYLDKESFNRNDKIYLYTENDTLEYELLAIKIVTEKENEHMLIDTSTEERWIEHINKLVKDTKYCKDNCTIDKDDQILVLQTCNLNPKDTYIIIIGKRIMESS